MTQHILVLNSGSSSIKFGLYETTQPEPTPIITGRIGGIGRAPDFTAKRVGGDTISREPLALGPLAQLDKGARHGELTTALLDWIDALPDDIDLVAAGHRVVHGGEQFAKPAVITPEVFKQLDALTPLAPLHQPNNLAAVTAIEKRTQGKPALTQVACFDTSFHRTMPRVAQLFGLPRAMADSGVIRYGFHGLSYDYIASVLPDLLPAAKRRKVVVAHLGNGASMCAMDQLQSVNTTMGFTALHGLIMGRRSGTLDAGIVLHLIQQRGMSADEVWQMLYRESGLLGVSGISNSMQELTASKEPAAQEAVELFCYRAACEIGSLAASMQGLDAIVFTAGIGENSAPVRQAICERLAWLGLDLNSAANDAAKQTISTENSKITAMVIPTNEQLVIARATANLAQSR
jgi:acetate kinase